MWHDDTEPADELTKPGSSLTEVEIAGRCMHVEYSPLPAIPPERCNSIMVPGVPWEETLYGSDLMHVASECGGDWKWFVTTVWYSPSRGKYFRGFDAGCSCRAPWDRNVPISDFQVGSKEEATKRLPQKMKIEVRDFDPTAVKQ